CNVEQSERKSGCQSSATVHWRSVPLPRLDSSLPFRRSVGLSGRARKVGHAAGISISKRDETLCDANGPTESGLTIVRASRQPKKRDSRARVKRIASLAR